MTALLADAVRAGPFWGYSIADIAIGIVIFFAVIALVYVALVHIFDMPPPPWLIKVFWIVVGAAVIILAIKLVASLW